MSLPLTDVGKGLPGIVHCRQQEPKEPHFSRGCEAAGLADQITSIIIHHWVASLRTGSLHEPTVSTSIQHQALHG